MPGALGYLTHYLAVQQHPGYRGYLWVNFDVYLNVSQLARFPLDNSWGPGRDCEWEVIQADAECHGGWHWWWVAFFYVISVGLLIVNTKCLRR